MTPRVLHSIWVGPPMPDHLREYVRSWTAVNVGWEHRLWGEDDLDWLQNQDLFDFAEAYTTSVGQFRSDIARYEILYRYGGLYVDCDFEALQPIDDLIAGVDCFAAWETDDAWVGNAVLGSVPDHPFLAELIDGLPANVRANKGKRPNFLTGPRYLTPLALRHDVEVFPSSLFYPYNFQDVGTEREQGPWPDAVAVHHWQNRRNRLGAPAPTG